MGHGVQSPCPHPINRRCGIPVAEPRDYTLIFSEAKDFAVLGEKSVKGKREMYTIGA